MWDLVPDYIYRWGELYGHYTNGYLLNAGGIADQPEWYVKAMTAFQSNWNKVRDEKMESHKQS